MPRSTLATTVLECADVSQQLALRGVLPWLICGAVTYGTATGSLTWDASAVLGLIAGGLQVASRRIASTPKESDDRP